MTVNLMSFHSQLLFTAKEEFQTNMVPSFSHCHHSHANLVALYFLYFFFFFFFPCWVTWALVTWSVFLFALETKVYTGKFCNISLKAERGLLELHCSLSPDLNTQPICLVLILMVVWSRSSVVLLWASRIIACFIGCYSWWLLLFSRLYMLF